MRKFQSVRFVALILVLCFVLPICLSACNPQSDDHDHADKNNDGKCDVCGETVDIHRHIDMDGDNICDDCGQDLSSASSVVITATAPKTEIEPDESMKITVTVEGADDTTYTWTYSKANVVTVDENNILSVVNPDLRLTTTVTVTVVSNADSNATDSFNVTVKVPTKEGYVGLLSSDTLREFGSKSLTVTGTVTDIYQDLDDYTNSYTNTYECSVKMSGNESGGTWLGSWNGEGETSVLTNLYKSGESEINSIAYDDNYNYVRVTGHALQECYVDKYNEVSSKNVTDYLSHVTLWESQHLWNHFAELDINNFEYNSADEVYEYNHNDDTDELYLMMYMAVSLTPILGEETDYFDKFYLIVDDEGNITGLKATTYVQEEYTENSSGVTEVTTRYYTEVNLTFSDVGTTEIETLSSYTAGQYDSALQAALTNMKTVSSYTFEAVEKDLSYDSVDEDDYSYESYTTSAGTSSSKVIRTKAQANGSSSKGTVGLKGWVTSDAILLKETSQYTATMDDNIYRIEYTGYKNTGDGVYDYFTYSSSAEAYVGQRKYTGTIADVLPSFDFASALFSFSGTDGNNHYIYDLQNTSICRDLAMSVVVDGECYATYSTQIAYSEASFQICIDPETSTIMWVKFPFAATLSGTGSTQGYFKITFTNVGSTVMYGQDADEPFDVFENYVERVIPTSWAEVTMADIYYYDLTASRSDQSNFAYGLPADTVFQNIFGDAFDETYFFTYQDLFEVFEDNVSGPFNNDISTEDADGNVTYKRYITFTARTSDVDENHRYTLEQFTELCEKFRAQLAKYGFLKDEANTDMSGGTLGESDVQYCLYNDKLQIRFESNHTGNFWIYVYNIGDYTLKR